MSNINFSEFFSPEIQNKRKDGGLKPKVQQFDNLKYRKAKIKRGGQPETVLGQFYVSKAMAAELQIESNALRHFVHPKDKNTVLLAVVDEKDGKYMKKRKDREKGDAFKNENLEAVLATAGVIDTSDAAIGTNQFIDYKEVASDVTVGKEGIKAKKVYQLSKGTAKEQAEETAQEAAAPTAAPQTEAPKAEAAPAPAPAAEGEDW